MQQPAKVDLVRIFSDGACSGNPGPGGWAFIMEHPASGKRIEHSGAEPMTTNNRMEIISALQGLTMLKRPCRVELVTDSQYLAKGISEWLAGWRSNGYKRREAGKLRPLQNEDLWRLIDEQVSRHQIQVIHVKGHSGHPENERCDKLAVAAYKKLMADSKSAASRILTSPVVESAYQKSTASETYLNQPAVDIPEQDYYTSFKQPTEPEIAEIASTPADLSLEAEAAAPEPLVEKTVKSKTGKPRKSIAKPMEVEAPARKTRTRKTVVDENPVLDNLPETAQPIAESAPKKRGRKSKET
ncbi:MAG: ribonuclease HI [bacterium]